MCHHLLWNHGEEKGSWQTARHVRSTHRGSIWTLIILSGTITSQWTQPANNLNIEAIIAVAPRSACWITAAGDQGHRQKGFWLAQPPKHTADEIMTVSNSVSGTWWQVGRMIIGRVLLMSTLRCVGALESFWQLLWSSLSCLEFFWKIKNIFLLFLEWSHQPSGLDDFQKNYCL